MSGPGVALTTPALTNDWIGVADMAKGIKGSSPACSVDGCTNPMRRRQLCSMHYQRAKKAGVELPPALTPTPWERFITKVNQDGPVPDYRPDLGPCWIWQGSREPKGYGHFRWSGGLMAHRFSYVASGREIPAGYQVDHLCRVTACVNPDHLEAVTPFENVMRGNGAPARFRRRSECLPETVEC